MATMTEAVQAALIGPERKKLKIYGHEFNVKPAELKKTGSRLVVNGQISHHLSLRPDDQIYYIITIENAVIADIKREMERGGLAGLAAPIVSAFGAYNGVPIPSDKVEEIGRRLGTLADGPWEKAAEIIIANIAMAFGQMLSPIRDKWVQLGAERGFLGRPVPDETTAPTPIDGIGRYNHFEHGSIFWTRDTGAHEVHGLIRDKWAELRWEQGALGYPITDETPTPDSFGRYNHFEHGSIYWTPETGAHEVHGAIRDKWAELGWEQSEFGYPITDETPTPDGQGRRSGFQRGSIEWTPDGGARVVVV